MAISPTTVFDSFSRSATDSWGTSDSGHAWLGTTINHDAFSGGTARVFVPLNGGESVAFINLTNNKSQEVLVKAKHTVSTLTDHGPVVRRASFNTFYFARLKDGEHKVYVSVSINGIVTDLASASFNLLTDTFYWMRLRWQSDTLSLKVWEEGAAEPASWTVEADTSAIAGAPGAGDGGYRAKGTSGGTYSVYLASYLWYSLEDTENGLPVTDTFNRTDTHGFGRSTSGHLWEGNLADDPTYYALTGEGSVGDGVGKLTTVNDGTGRFAAVGPIVANSDTTARFKVDNASTSPNLNLGLRGTIQANAGVREMIGYFGRLTLGSTTFSLREYATFGGGSTQIGSFTLAAAPAVGEWWWMRLQAEGTTIRARAWKDGTSEPGSWQVSVTDTTHATGRGWIQLTGSGSGTYNFEIEDYAHTVISTTNELVTGTLSVASTADTSVAVTASYTNDNDADSTCAIQYRRQDDDGAWSNATVTTNRGPKTFTASIGGLATGTVYEFKATYTDPDGVTGTNPKTTTFTTALGGLDTDDLSLVAAATTIDVTASYDNDTDDDSTALVQYRSLGTVTQLVNEEFEGTEGTLLETLATDEGYAWVKHPTSVASMVLDGDDHVYTDTASARALYYPDVAMPSADYDLYARLTWVTLAGEIGLAGRIDATNADYYYCGYRLSTQVWFISKVVGGTATDLGTVEDTTIDAVGETRTVRLTFRGSTIALIVNNVPVLSVTDSTHTSAGYAGIRGFGVGNGVVMNWLDVFVFSASGSYDAGVAMTADRPNKQFTKQLTGLSPDTTYEVKVTFSDADAVRGINPLVETATTLGKGIKPLTLTATPTDISATLVLDYDLDTNANASCAFQYRSIRQSLWTTVPPTSVSNNLVSTQFRAVIGGLTPNLTYEVQATVSDPDGVATGSPTTFTTLFTTKGDVLDADKRRKHYVWKVYDEDGTYVGTWRDAPNPEFAWHENGGVTDLSITLPRKLSDLNNDATIDFGHRVDVWAIDGLSEGLGPNLLADSDMDLGAWTLGTSWLVDADGGPDDGSALRFSSGSATQQVSDSEQIALEHVVPLVVSAVARARSGKLVLSATAYAADDNVLETSEDFAETVGTLWQRLTFEFTPPPDTAYVKVRTWNDGKGNMWLDKVSVLAKEVLVYRGRIESYVPKVSQEGEEIEIEILGTVAQTSDMYIPFLQYVTTQPTKDTNAGRVKTGGPTDPSNIMKKLIDVAQEGNPRCDLRYTDDSVKLTGTTVEYTLRDQRLDAAMDKVRALCPPGWNYYIDPTGLVHLRGPEHVATHKLRLQVEVLEYSNDRSVRNLKNRIIVKGRQDEDETEPDGFGSINHVAFDQQSIDRYGLRELFVRDANIADPDTAEIVGEGRLEELSEPEEQGRAYVPDEKGIQYVGGALRGYNIESFRPGDFVEIKNPVSGTQRTYWDQFLWDTGQWDDGGNRFIPDRVPIKTVQYRDDHVVLELSQRQPSATGDFAKLSAWLRLQDADTSE